MDSLISINQVAGSLGALIECLCVVVERLAGDGGWRETDNGLQRITRDEPPVRDGRQGSKEDGEESSGTDQGERIERKGWSGLDAQGDFTGPCPPPPLPIFPPVPCWMTSTQTARHHDGHSPPLMSPSHS